MLTYTHQSIELLPQHMIQSPGDHLRREDTTRGNYLIFLNNTADFFLIEAECIHFPFIFSVSCTS